MQIQVIVSVCSTVLLHAEFEIVITYDKKEFLILVVIRENYRNKGPSV